MPSRKDPTVLKQLHTLFNVGAIRELTDGQLLERFGTEPGEAAELAFAVLVERHGPMILRVCRDILADPHDTQDAFQATFLVLVRKASALWVRDSLGPWLYQVAYRVARQARSAAARRRRHEQCAAAAAPEARTAVDDDLGRLLHEEIDRLPERYRAPLVLCDLGGRTHEQAARHLGWPVGTVKSRLSRGRDRLRDRLRRRGLAPHAGLVAAALRPGGPEVAVPAALADATTRAAVQSMMTRTILSGSAAALAQGVLSTMSAIHGLKVVAVILAVSAAVSSVPLLAQRAGNRATVRVDGDAAANDIPVVEVQPGKLKGSMIERGVVEASSNIDVFSKVEGQTTILSLLPEGTAVKKGDVVCELDSSALRDHLAKQAVETPEAEAAYNNARLTREVAEIAVTEYEEGIFRQETETALGEIALAASSMQKAENRLDRTRRARKELDELLASKKGARTSGDILADLDVDERVDGADDAIKRAKIQYEQAKTKSIVLQKFTHAKVVKQLNAEVEKARSNELAKNRTWQGERTKMKGLEIQIEHCTLHAPGDGMINYAHDDRFGGRPPIEEGATIRERQKVFSIPDLKGSFRVQAKVSEPMIARIKYRLPARIKVDAFGTESLTGAVVNVSPLPDLASFYTARIEIKNPPLGLRPGMVAQVELLLDELADVLRVPLGAILHDGGKHRVAVKKPDGSVDWREVTLGVTNDEVVEITQGIKSGEFVVRDPAALLSAGERREKFGTSAGLPEKPGAPR